LTHSRKKEVPGMLSVRPDTPHDGCRVDDELGIGILQRRLDRSGSVRS
jgi:hypothetical protein